MESEIDRGVFVDRTEAERGTVGDLIDRYLREVTPRKKSARREKQRLNALKSHFGAFSPASLRNGRAQCGNNSQFSINHLNFHLP